mmetsp:Transcript_2407/g.4996  ORF Transcript_2407/g.4996 Transcript_2407/m.4996 type:complete len:861 (-) Transcript_2407:23-2605(-)
MSESAEAFPPPPADMENSISILEGEEEPEDPILSQSQLDVLAQKLSPSFSLYDVDELFSDENFMSSSLTEGDVLGEDEIDCGAAGGVLPTSPPSKAFDDEEEDDEMDNEEKNLSDVEKRIQDEINASNTSFRMAMMSAAAAASATSTPTKTPTTENPDSSRIINLSSPMTPSLTSPHPMDSSFMKQMRRNSTKDMKKASELLKGTEDLKRQLEELSSLATWNDDGNLIIRPPTPPPPPSNLNRSISDKNHLTVQLSDRDSYSREFVEKLTLASLAEIFCGYSNLGLDGNTRMGNALFNRCCCVRVRPDVLCGAVMDAVSTALRESGCTIERRQGGHLIATLPWVEIDVQLCVKRETLARVCILTAHEVPLVGGEGVFRSNNTIASPDSTTAGNDQQDDEIVSPTRIDQALSDPLEELRFSSENLGFTRKLVDTVVSSTPLRRFSHGSPEDPKKSPQSPAEESDAHLTPPEKVKRRVWLYIGRTIEELESRDLLFASLDRCPFGAFPALPAIDKQMVQLLQVLAREKMKSQLLSQASELEEYARAAEYSCASIIDMLSPMFKAYEIPEIPLPKPMPLSAYPMDQIHIDDALVLAAQQEVGAKVESWKRERTGGAFDEDDTLNSARSDSEDEDLSDGSQKTGDQGIAEECVKIVFSAVQRQYDVELMARVGRKNVQVMDRLAKMSTHKEKMLSALSNSEHPEAARLRSDSCSETPIYWCRVIRGAGGSQGRAYFSQGSITIVSTNTVTLGMGAKNTITIPINDMDVVQLGGANRITLVYKEIIGGREAQESFTPLMVSSKRLKDLIMSVVDVAENRTIKFTEEGGLLYRHFSEETDASLDETSDDDFVVLTHSPRGTSKKDT